MNDPLPSIEELVYVAYPHPYLGLTCGKCYQARLNWRCKYPRCGHCKTKNYNRHHEPETYESIVADGYRDHEWSF
jgi:hypothetical protein